MTCERSPGPHTRTTAPSLTECPFSRSNVLATYKRFYPAHKGKSGRKGRKSGKNSCQAANCRPEIEFRATDSPAIRCLPQVPRWPFKLAQVLGHNPDSRAPGPHPDGFWAFCRERVWALRGARGSKGSFAWQRSRFRWRRDCYSSEVQAAASTGNLAKTEKPGSTHERRFLRQLWI